jgi:hypothetical protein
MVRPAGDTGTSAKGILNKDSRDNKREVRSLENKIGIAELETKLAKAEYKTKVAEECGPDPMEQILDTYKEFGYKDILVRAREINASASAQLNIPGVFRMPNASAEGSFSHEIQVSGAVDEALNAAATQYIDHLRCAQGIDNSSPTTQGEEVIEISTHLFFNAICSPGKYRVTDDLNPDDPNHVGILDPYDPFIALPLDPVPVQIPPTKADRLIGECIDKYDQISAQGPNVEQAVDQYALAYDSYHGTYSENSYDSGLEQLALYNEAWMKNLPAEHQAEPYHQLAYVNYSLAKTIGDDGLRKQYLQDAMRHAKMSLSLRKLHNPGNLDRQGDSQRMINAIDSMLQN